MFIRASSEFIEFRVWPPLIHPCRLRFAKLGGLATAVMGTAWREWVDFGEGGGRPEKTRRRWPSGVQGRGRGRARGSLSDRRCYRANEVQRSVIDKSQCLRLRKSDESRLAMMGLWGWCTGKHTSNCGHQHESMRLNKILRRGLSWPRAHGPSEALSERETRRGQRVISAHAPTLSQASPDFF